MLPGCLSSPRSTQGRIGVPDSSYVWALAGYVYVIFVVDDFSRRLLGWREANLSWSPTPGGREDPVNDSLAAFAEKDPNTTVVDWHDAIADHPDELAPDRIHPGPDGGARYADCVEHALNP